jgi:hypothetical protein
MDPQKNKQIILPKTFYNTYNRNTLGDKKKMKLTGGRK